MLHMKCSVLFRLVADAMLTGGIFAFALFAFASSSAFARIPDSPAEESKRAEAKLEGFHLVKDHGVSIAFRLLLPAEEKSSDWKVYVVPRLQALWHEVVPEMAPVEAACVDGEYCLPIASEKDYLTLYTFRGVSAGGRSTAMKDVSVAYLAKIAGDAVVLSAAKKAYLAQGTTPNPYYPEWALGIEKTYRMKDTGTVVVEVDIAGFRPGREVNLVAWGDNHLKLADDRDRASENISLAFQRRGKANPPETGTHSLTREMELAPIFDGTVILGDNVDFFSYGSYALWKRMVLDVEGAEPLVVIGYHDYVTHTINKRPQKEMPEAVTMPVCVAHTPNDVRYATRLVGGRVLMVGLDASKNGNFYWENKIHEKLAADVKRARENGWTILLFQHEGQFPHSDDSKMLRRHTMSTKDREMDYGRYAAGLDDPKKQGFSQVRGTKAVYDVVWHNADVIRGVFHGHVHANYATWINAVTPDGTSKPIPQYSCQGSVFFLDGWIFRINVK